MKGRTASIPVVLFNATKPKDLVHSQIILIFVSKPVTHTLLCSLLVEVFPYPHILPCAAIPAHLHQGHHPQEADLQQPEWISCPEANVFLELCKNACR